MYSSLGCFFFIKGLRSNPIELDSDNSDERKDDFKSLILSKSL